MSDPAKEAGVLTTVIKRAVDLRLPKALEMQQRVDAGGLLDKRDMAFLEEVFRDAQVILPMASNHPEFHDVGMRMLQIYKDVLARALENEKARPGS